MISLIRILCLFSFIVYPGYAGYTQNVAVGSWDSHLPYNTAKGLATDGNRLYTLCNQAFFSINSNNTGDMVKYSKIDGMSDIGMNCAAYDMATSTLVLVYDNGNIDLFKDNTFYNLPYLKMKVIPDKTVSHVYTSNGFAYLASAMGVVVIDLSKRSITTTIELPATIKQKNVLLSVTGFAAAGNYFFAATENGVYRADKNTNLQGNPQAWKRIDSTSRITNITTVADNVFFSSSSAVYKLTADSLESVYTASRILRRQIRTIDGGAYNLLISEFSDSTRRGSVQVMDVTGNVTDSASMDGVPLQALELLNKSIWIADSANGLCKRTSATETAYFIPQGPSSRLSYDIYAYNKDVYVAHGEYNGFFGGNFTRFGFSHLNGDQWKLYKPARYPEIGSDMVLITKDETNGTLYAGSYLNGLTIVKADGSFQKIDRNSIFDGSYIYGDDYHQTIGLHLDKSENLWVSQLLAKHQLYVKTKSDEWYKFQVPDVSFGGPLTTDDNGQVYFLSLAGNSPLAGGAVVYSTNGTLTDATDDISHRIMKGVGYGNLPSNDVLCIAKDKNNEIWIGTGDGIGIIKTNCNAPFSATAACEAVIPVVQYGLNPGPLFKGIRVNTIAIDEINRKWVGTNAGLWVLSADAEQLLYHFTTDNSPMPHNNVQKVAIDRGTGSVYIGTAEGLVSFRSTITEAGTANAEAIIFPNPVPAGYSGLIAIKDIIPGSDVRITDITGQLVYHARATGGGQLTWDGKDPAGRKAQSGVYLVYIAGADGKNTHTGKLVFVQ